MSEEVLIRCESVRMHPVRAKAGSLSALLKSIQTEGLHRPITVWSDGSLISGFRRLTAHYTLGRETIPAVFVHTVEDAAKRLLGDIQDDTCAKQMAWSEVCSLWHLMRTLDAPNAAKRADEARRRGVELRRQTQAGLRTPGRGARSSEDYVLTVLCEPFGISVQTARRVEVVWETANGYTDADETLRRKAQQIMHDIDTGESIWSGHQKLMGLAPRVRDRKKKPDLTPPAEAAKQLQAWEKSLPMLEGLIVGLVELGPPNPELTWEQVGPVHARLSAVRRTLEQKIKQMKEASQ
jgi:ParB family chromosome partitioning protein